MQHNFGLNNYELRKNSVRTPIWWNTGETLNGHLQISGMTGAGKSHQLRRLVSSAARSGVEIDIFDVHDDLSVPGVTRDVIISESTRYGYNLLSLNSDPHSGGVRKKINSVVQLINCTNLKLGCKQESALRYLLRDVFYLGGIHEDDPSTWHKLEITESIRNEIIRNKDWAQKKKYYPTIDDLISLCDRKLHALYTGGDTTAVVALERVHKSAQALHRLTSNGNRYVTDEEHEKEKEKFKKAKEDAITAFSNYIEKMQTGRELQDVIKYNSKDVLQGVLERLQNLNSSGIFRPNPPPFGGHHARCHQIKSLSEEEQKLYIYTRAEAIFRARKDRGQVDDVQHILLIDEAHAFFDDEGDNILNTISKEGRKFGMALWCSSQSPTHFSDDFLSACGAILMLYIHPIFWPTCSRKLNIDVDMLKFMKPGEVGAVKLQKKRQIDSRFVHVCLDENEIHRAA